MVKAGHSQDRTEDHKDAGLPSLNHSCPPQNVVSGNQTKSSLTNSVFLPLYHNKTDIGLKILIEGSISSLVIKYAFLLLYFKLNKGLYCEHPTPSIHTGNIWLG